ncbi:MAG: hypothetical protein DELT_01093 [Desulfovibrio sp.]
MRKIRVAFVKFGGLSAGGTERWLQMMAANLDPGRFAVDYYYCDAAPYVGSDYRHADTDASRVRYMQEHGVNLIKFHVGAKDITVPTHDWRDTDFWDVFTPDAYDLVQTAKAGPAEYPYHLIPLPVVEYVALAVGVDHSPNIVWSVYSSAWQCTRRVQAGGGAECCSLIPVPAFPPATGENLRKELGIAPDSLVAGFHQRASEEIFSPIPLQAFAALRDPNRHFVIMGGAEKYRAQARELGLSNVHFLPHSGEAEGISRFLNTLDVFAHGRADGETFGTVFAEAMYHGKCCLSHTSPIANAQVETMGPAGLFADGLDAYTADLERLFEDTQLRSKLSAKARPHAERYYSLDACVASLSDTYTRIMGRPVCKKGTEKLPYGVASSGWLQAGGLTNPEDLAHHILTDSSPEGFDAHVFRYFAKDLRSMLDVGAGAGLYSSIATHVAGKEFVCHAFEPAVGQSVALAQTVFLNNWEERLFVHTVADFAIDFDAFIKEQAVPTVDFIKINAKVLTSALFQGAQHIIEQYRPILFFDLADNGLAQDQQNPDFSEMIQWLYATGYDVFVCAPAGKLMKLDASNTDQAAKILMSFLCLPREKTPVLQHGLERWCRVYRQRMLREKAKKQLKRIVRFARKAVKNPARAVQRVIQEVLPGKQDADVRKPASQDAQLSFARHDAQMREPDAVQRVRIVYAKYHALNTFDAPSHKHATLLAKYPDVRKYAVDIGSGGGWLSARLSYEFETVYSIEPSAAGLALADVLFPSAGFPNIVKIEGLAEEVLPTLTLDAPAYFATATVLGHLPDTVVEKICIAINKSALPGSLLSFSEWWGKEYHRELWHIRSQEWWRARFPAWKLTFHGQGMKDAVTIGDGKGIHGVRID